MFVNPKVAFDIRMKVKDWKGQEVEYAQVKENGYRLSLVVESRKRRFALGRTKDYTEQLEKHAAIRRQLKSLPIGTIVEGELYVPGKKSTYVPTAIRTADPNMVFAAFAAPVVEKEDWRMHHFEDVMGGLEDRFGFKVPEWERISPYEDDIKQFYLERTDEQGIEGFVLKNENHYDKWYKIKPVRTCDVVITGTKPGNNSFIGYVGGIKCSVWHEGKLVEIASVSGMTMDLREDVSDMDDRGKLVGLVAEIKYTDFAEDRLWHPRFLRLRDDKPSEECTMEQVQ